MKLCPTAMTCSMLRVSRVKKEYCPAFSLHSLRVISRFIGYNNIFSIYFSLSSLNYHVDVVVRLREIMSVLMG